MFLIASHLCRLMLHKLTTRTAVGLMWVLAELFQVGVASPVSGSQIVLVLLLRNVVLVVRSLVRRAAGAATTLAVSPSVVLVEIPCPG